MTDAGSMHILHVIDGIDVGGAEMVLVQLVEGLQAAGHQNTVAVLSTCGPLADRLSAAGAVVRPLGMKRGRLPVAGVRHLLRAAREARPTIVQGWMYHGNLAASVANFAAGDRARVVWSIHNTIEPPPHLPRITRAAMRLTKAASQSPAAIVYVSKAAARQHERSGFSAARSRFIPNGTDCTRFRPRAEAGARLRAELGISPGIPLVGLFARWHPMKGHAVLFDAAASLVTAGQPIHLLLAGTGSTPANAELLTALEARGLIGHASLLGERGDVDALMPALDVFALPSVYGEAFPLVLGEAMAAGVPCIASDVGDARLILGGTGRIVPPSDAGALTNALRALIVAGPAERRRLGELARARVDREFSLEAMVRAYQTLYDSVSRPDSASSRLGATGAPPLRPGMRL